MNIAIIRAFIALRKLALQKNELSDLFQKLKEELMNTIFNSQIFTIQLKICWKKNQIVNRGREEKE
jgi:hypothetical protein